MKKIVIIDDSKEITSSLEDLLCAVGYKAFAVNDAESGLNIIKKEIPHLIISDIMMPVLDGFYLLQKIKSDTAINHIPIIIITAKTEKDTMTKSLSAGASYFIQKPFSIKNLLTIVNSYVLD